MPPPNQIVPRGGTKRRSLIIHCLAIAKLVGTSVSTGTNALRQSGDNTCGDKLIVRKFEWSDNA